MKIQKGPFDPENRGRYILDRKGTVHMVGWRYGVLVGSFLTVVGVGMYFAVYEPMVNADKYRAIQEKVREGEDIVDRQPGHMKPFKSPFKPT